MESSSSFASSFGLFKFSRCFLIAAITFTILFILYSSTSNVQRGYGVDNPIIVSLLNNYTNLVAHFRDKNSNSCKYQVPSNKKNYTNLIDKQVWSLDTIESRLVNMSINVSMGGKSFAIDNYNCSTSSRDYSRIAFIIPYRNRSDNLRVFLNNMHPFLTRQQIDYGVYLIEPAQNLTFNRALLLNIGFIESQRDMSTKSSSMQQSYWNCFVFHDVDMIPEDERIVYGCNKESPMHYAVAVSKFGYSTTGYFTNYFGGINSFTREQFIAINGFSNIFYGWGGEDDDAYLRTVEKFHQVIKLPPEIGRYWTHEHSQDVPNPERFKLLDESKKMLNQGLSTIEYKVRSVITRPLFTRILVTYPDKQKST